ncbi:MAG: SprT-like domain-containing protein, partial [Gemmatimonadaceae bacterium]
HSRQAPVKYNLDFPLEDFTRADALVRATLLATGRVDTWNSVRRVTTDVQDLERVRRHVVTRSLSQTGSVRGITFEAQHNRHEFDMWLNPDAVTEDNSNFRATLVHELCHVYLGTSRGHDKVWRRLYARALFHYHHAVSPIDHHIALVDLNNWRYTKRAKSENTAQFLKRINADREDWIVQASHEFEKVNETWKRMTSRS